MNHSVQASGGWDWEALRGRALRETERVLAGRADAEDAAQEAMLRAWRSRGACRASEDPGGWLACIARREAFRLSTRPDRARETSIAEPPSRHSTPSHADRVELSVDVGRALGRLSEGDRAIIGLRYGADMTQPAVAAALGLPEGTAKVRLHRLRRQLSADLTGDMNP